MEGIGREYGRDRTWPFCSCRSRKPASILAFLENGGVCTSPCSQTKGLSFGLIYRQVYVRSDIYASALTRFSQVSPRICVSDDRSRPFPTATAQFSVRHEGAGPPRGVGPRIAVFPRVTSSRYLNPRTPKERPKPRRQPTSWTLVIPCWILDIQSFHWFPIGAVSHAKSPAPPLLRHSLIGVRSSIFKKTHEFRISINE